jgi:peptidoglycan/LPS O-acetylase OafA/YrhL
LGLRRFRQLSMPPHSHPSYRPDIDGLRAIAVLAVVGFHAAPHLVPGGFVGVDVFFVISGYLISRIIYSALAQDGFSFADFYARRVRRIFPALALVLAASLLFGWFCLLGDEYETLGRETAAGVAFAANLLLWQESGYFDSAAALKPLLHLWSLGVEEQFYLVWPVIVVIAHRYRLNLLRIAALLATISLALNLLQTSSQPSTAFYLPHSRFWEFLCGAILAYTAYPKHNIVPTVSVGTQPGTLRVPSRRSDFQRIIPKPKKAVRQNIQSAGGFLLLTAAIALFNQDMAFPGWRALLPTLGTTLLIWAGPHAWLNRKLLANHSVVFIGLISYPLYLWHWPLLSFARMIGFGKLGSGVKVACVAAAFLLAWLTYKFVERPLRTRRAGRYKAAFAVPPLAAALAIIGGLGIAIAGNAGIPSRFPEVVRSLANYQYDNAPVYRMGRCFLDADQQDPPIFQEECLDKTSEPLVFLWGDSHAAHLYAGIHALQQDYAFSLAQYTSSGCPPILGAVIPSRPACTGINQMLLEKIAQLKPDTLVMAANWPSYYEGKPKAKVSLDMLRQTIASIQSLGVKHILLIGTVPQWDYPLPKTLFNAYRANKFATIPTRLRFSLKSAGSGIDPKLAELAGTMGIAYFSPKSVLCDAEGCLTTTDGTVENLTAFDYAHLTEAGAVFLLQNSRQAIFPHIMKRNDAGSHP